ncbi:hypothetical protein [Xanthomonas albilineans]|uniref:hypothetical protein n=1 Tax=Xanthomonas albilineans TaxID=29447 RepID=UPI001F37055B|nr:hypothetical protein [Xanthomonas albilineans]
MMAAHPAWRLSSAKPAPRYRDHALGSRLFFSLPTGGTMAVRSPFATPSRAALPLLLTAVFAHSLTGCSRMNTPINAPTNEPPGIHLIGNIPVDAHNTVHIDTSKPIPFAEHAFGAMCYDTYGCKVLYDGRYEANDPDDVKQISSASLGDGYPDNLDAHTIGIRNFPHFPPPAEVTWRSKDGQPHHALVDLEAIFKDKVILHHVPQDQLPPILHADISPHIILEVNDRNINVYMRAMVQTTVLQKPGNEYSHFRDDLILAYTKTY